MDPIWSQIEIWVSQQDFGFLPKRFLYYKVRPLAKLSACAHSSDCTVGVPVPTVCDRGAQYLHFFCTFYTQQRCNLTHHCYERALLLQQYAEDAHLYSACHPSDACALCYVYYTGHCRRSTELESRAETRSPDRFFYVLVSFSVLVTRCLGLSLGLGIIS